MLCFTNLADVFHWKLYFSIVNLIDLTLIFTCWNILWQYMDQTGKRQRYLEDIWGGLHSILDADNLVEVRWGTYSISGRSERSLIVVHACMLSYFRVFFKSLVAEHAFQGCALQVSLQCTPSNFKCRCPISVRSFIRNSIAVYYVFSLSWCFAGFVW